MAAKINFKDIHKAIKDKMTTSGLKYLTAASWFNFKLGVFPVATTHGDKYTIMPGSGNATEQYEAADWNETPWSIEFCLSGKNDLYLSKIGPAYDAVRSLESIEHNNLVEIEFKGWEMQNIGDNVVLTFIIMLTINE